MAGVKFIATEYAIRNTPSPCKECGKRQVNCRKDCEAHKAYLVAFDENVKKIEKAYIKENAASNFLATSARATRHKDQRRKRR